MNYLRPWPWSLQMLKLKFESFKIVHHVHLAHQCLQSLYSFCPMLQNYRMSLIFVKLLIIIIIVHAAKRRTQIFKFNFTVNIIILMEPPSEFLKLLIYQSLLPICIFQDSQQSIKMDLFHKRLFPFNRIGYFSS